VLHVIKINIVYWCAGTMFVWMLNSVVSTIDNQI
jgi:hypothetical protein